jgi:hypothetical protein
VPIGEASRLHHPTGPVRGEAGAVLQPGRRRQGPVGCPRSLPVPQPGEAQHLCRKPFLGGDQLGQPLGEGVAGRVLPVLTGQIGNGLLDSSYRVPTAVCERFVPFQGIEHMFCIMPAGYDKKPGARPVK